MTKEDTKRKLIELQKFDGQLATLERRLHQWIPRFNPFDVLKKAHDEHCHSNVLAWLLDSRENHGLGNEFLRQLLGRYMRSPRGRPPLRTKQFSIRREEGHIDILAVSDNNPKSVIAIENKIRSREHGKQLREYHDYLDERYGEYKKVLILLSPEGTPPKADDWDIMTYADVAMALETAMRTKQAAIPRQTRTFLNDYLAVVRKDILMDSKLTRKCEQVYRKHKEALDLILANCPGPRTLLGESMDRAFNGQPHNTFRRAESSRTGMLVLQSTQIDKILTALPEANGSWGTKEAYRFWISPARSDDEKLVGHFEIGLWNIPPQNMQVVEKLKSIFKKNKPKSRYCRLGKQITADIGRAYEDDTKYDKIIKKAVFHILDGFADLERRICKELSTSASNR